MLNLVLGQLIEQWSISSSEQVLPKPDKWIIKLLFVLLLVRDLGINRGLNQSHIFNLKMIIS